MSAKACVVELNFVGKIWDRGLKFRSSLRDGNYFYM